MKQYILLAGFLLVSCSNQNDGDTITSPYTKEQVFDLEIKAAQNDVDALHELQMHYDFSDQEEKSKKIDKQLLDLKDPPAMDKEAHRLSSLAKKTQNNNEKIRHLDDAVKLAREAAKIQGIPDAYISNDSTVQYVENERAKLR
jgi:site-specific DNA-cytosine methylase